MGFTLNAMVINLPSTMIDTLFLCQDQQSRLLENHKWVATVQSDNISMSVDTPKDLDRIKKIISERSNNLRRELFFSLLQERKAGDAYFMKRG